MMAKVNDLSPQQALLMWSLLGLQGEAAQSVIVPAVKKADREALVEGRFIRSTEKRPFILSVEDKGWRWASEHLDAELPPNCQALKSWLALIGKHLRDSNRTLADFIGPAPTPAKPSPTPSARRARPARAKKQTKAKPPTPAQLRKRIERAYLAVTGGKKAEKVMLSKLRAELADLDRATVDAGLLRILQGDPKARLGQMNSLKELSRNEQQATFNPGGEPFHYLWIQS